MFVWQGNTNTFCDMNYCIKWFFLRKIKKKPRVSEQGAVLRHNSLPSTSVNKDCTGAMSRPFLQFLFMCSTYPSVTVLQFWLPRYVSKDYLSLYCLRILCIFKFPCELQGKYWYNAFCTFSLHLDIYWERDFMSKRPTFSEVFFSFFLSDSIVEIVIAAFSPFLSSLQILPYTPSWF